MRVMQYLRYSLLFMCLLCVWSPAQAAVVTLDVGAKTAVSDDESIVANALRVQDRQVGVLIQNTTDAAKTVKLVFKGLVEQEYDVYLDGAYMESKPVDALREGLALNLSGMAFDQLQMKCLRTAKPGLDVEYKRLQGIEERTDEENRALSLIRDAVGFVRSGTRVDERNRSVSVLIAPKDSALQRMGFPTKLPMGDAVKSIAKACRDMQDVRSRVSRDITGSELHYSAMSALTPVTLFASCMVSNGVPSIGGKLTNDTNLPVSCDVTVDVPQGWKADPAKLHLDVKAGSSSLFSVPLVRESKDAALPDIVITLADVTITEDKFTASLQLKAAAERQSK